MATRWRAELAYVRMLVPHYWKVGLALVGAVSSIWGLVHGSPIGIVGGALLLAGIAATLSDYREVRRKLDLLYALPSNEDLSAIELAGGYEDFDRLVASHGAAITDPAVNRWLRQLEDLPMTADSTEYRAPTRVQWAHDLAVAVGRRRGARDFNDVKVRMRTDLTPGDLPTAVELQRTRYFFARITNDLVATELHSRDPSGRGLDARAVALPDGVLPPLRLSECSNHVGVDTLAITRRGELIVSIQTFRNNQSPGLLAPSGSGSADWRDVEWARKRRCGFLGFVRRAMERELAEECGVPVDRVRGTVVLGFARFLHRGGKPQFFGFTHLDVTSDDLRRTRQERAYVEAHHVERLDLTSSSAAAASLRDYSRREDVRVSMPLFVGVELLARWIEQDPSAIEHLRTCAPDAVLA
jgi:hypothetical protein